MTAQLRWLGNAGFEFQIDGTTLIIDPFLTRPKDYQLLFGRVTVDEAALQHHIRKCDAILVTHAHFDHCMDAPEIAGRTGASIYGSPNTCRIMQAAGVPEKQLNAVANGENFRIGRMRVSVLPAFHPRLPRYGYRSLSRELRFPAHLSDYRMDACYSYLLETEDRRILFWSSTHCQGAPRADLLTCRAVSSEHWYHSLLQQVQPQLVIPQHWDDFFRPLSNDPAPFWSSPQLRFPPIARIDLEDFRKSVLNARSDCRVLLPEIFKPYPIESN